MKHWVLVLAAFCAMGLVRAADMPPSPEANATVVLYNTKDPASLALAKYYAKRRSIPEGNLVGLDCPGDEEITRDAYLVRIEAPLRDAFTKRDWWTTSMDSEGRRFVASSKIRYAAIMRGVPMKIRADAKSAVTEIYRDIQPGSPMETLVQHNEASVDSELAAMFTLLEEAPAVLRNSYYRRFSRILDVPIAGSPFLVCRLDGPSDAIVRRMIDDAIETERRGLWGWAYIDARSITTPGYIEGDEWMTRAAAMMRRKGIPVICDYAPEILPAGFPVTDAAIYYGWYAVDAAGPFARPDFKFLPGAVAVHIHSFSARTIRDTTTGWAGPLLARGATATMGNVYEPYLSLTVHFDILQERLMAGFTLAEAAYSATIGLSWMNVVLGDPLYRPYAFWNSLDATEDLSNPWQRYRKIVLDAGGDVIAAGDELRAYAKEAGISMPLEALGQALAGAGRFDEALSVLNEAARMESSKTIRFRIALEQIEILRRAGRLAEALDRISDALGTFRSDDQQGTLGEITRILRPLP